MTAHLEANDMRTWGWGLITCTDRVGGVAARDKRKEMR